MGRLCGFFFDYIILFNQIMNDFEEVTTFGGRGCSLDACNHSLPTAGIASPTLKMNVKFTKMQSKQGKGAGIAVGSWAIGMLVMLKPGKHMIRCLSGASMQFWPFMGKSFVLFLPLWVFLFMLLVGSNHHLAAAAGLSISIFEQKIQILRFPSWKT